MHALTLSAPVIYRRTDCDIGRGRKTARFLFRIIAVGVASRSYPVARPVREVRRSLFRGIVDEGKRRYPLPVDSTKRVKKGMTMLFVGKSRSVGRSVWMRPRLFMAVFDISAGRGLRKYAPLRRAVARS